MFDRIYFCTECGLKKYKEQVHIRYGFAFRYSTKHFYTQYPFVHRWIYCRILCMCKKCFKDLAQESAMIHAHIRRNRG